MTRWRNGTRARRAIHRAETAMLTAAKLDCFVASLLAMTVIVLRTELAKYLP